MSLKAQTPPAPSMVPAAAPRASDSAAREWVEGAAAVLDNEGIIQECSQALESWLAVPAGRVRGRPITEVLAAHNTGLAAHLQKLLDQPGPFVREEVCAEAGGFREWFLLELTRAGRSLVFRLNSILPPPAELAESGWTGSRGSEKARRDVLVRLLRAEARLDNLIHRWPGIIFSQRADFSFSFVSAKIEELTGVGPGHWHGSPQKFWDIVHEADVEDLQQQFRALNRANQRLASTYRIRHAQTGRVSYVFECREALFSGNGLLLGYEGVWLDVTRQTIAENRLSSAAWKETLAVLTMGLAHDFSNIMAGILALSETFQAQVDKDHPFAEGLGLIKRNSQQASQLVHRILNLHQGKIGERNYHSLNDLVRDTVDLVEKVVPRRIEIKTSLANESLALYLDAFEFRQALVNLTINAADAMPQGGVLSFVTALVLEPPAPERFHGVIPRPPLVCLEVRDTGTGIAPKHLGAIFDAFFTTKPMNKGSGLGLYNTRLFVEKHHGAISVQSDEGKGTVFKIWLPPAKFSDEDQAAPETGRKRRTLLLVGPPGPALEGSVSFLRQNGYYAVCCGPAESPLEILASPSYQFDGVMVVLCGGGRSREPFLEDLERQGKNMKIILQVVGRNLDEIDPGIISRADLLLPPDLPDQEIARKLESLFDCQHGPFL